MSALRGQNTAGALSVTDRPCRMIILQGCGVHTHDESPVRYLLNLSTISIFQMKFGATDDAAMINSMNSHEINMTINLQPIVRVNVNSASYS